MLNEILWRYLHHIASVPLHLHHITSEGSGRGTDLESPARELTLAFILPPDANLIRARRSQNHELAGNRAVPWDRSEGEGWAGTRMLSSLHMAFCVNAYSNIRYSHIKNAPWKYKECFLAHQESNRKQTCTPVSW